MTLLSVVQNVASEAAYSVESTIIGNSEVTTKQLLTMTQRVVREMSEAYPWPKFYKSGSITLVDGQANYALPGDFDYYAYETFWNQSNRWRVLGPMSEQEYAEILGFGLNPSIYQRFQLRGVTSEELLINPTPDSGNAGQTIIFEYSSSRYVRPRQWAASQTYAAGAYTFNNGNYYQTQLGGTTGSTPPTFTSGVGSDGGVTWLYYSGEYKEFLADTDVAILNEKILEQGVLERFAEIKQLTVKPIFEVLLNEEYSRMNPGKVLFNGLDQRNVMFARSGRAVFGSLI